MKRKLILWATTFFMKRKVKKMEKSLGEVIRLSKLNGIIKKGERKGKVCKVIRIILICTGALAILTGIGFLVYKFLGRHTDDYDLYDDLDNYYDEADHYDCEEEALEGDFAE